MTDGMRNPPTTLFALLGRPVAGNPTGAMIEAACRSVGLDGGRYVSVDVSARGLGAAVGALRVLGVTASTTSPSLRTPRRR